jgi:hypothetical protein
VIESPTFKPKRKMARKIISSDSESETRSPVRPPTGAQRRKQHEEGERSALPNRQEERRVKHEGHQEATPRKSGTPVSDEELYARPVRPPTGAQRHKQHEEGGRSAPPKSLEERQIQHEGRQEATPRNSETQFSDEELYARPVRAATGTKRRKQHEEGERSALPKRLEERQVQHEGRQEATRRKSGTQNPKATVKPKITDQMKTTTLSMGTHDRPAGIKGWPPVNWDNLPKRLEERQVQHEGRQEATLRKSGTQFSDEELYGRPVRPPTGAQRRKQPEEGERTTLPKGLEKRRVKHEGHEEDTPRKSGTQFSDEELYARPPRLRRKVAAPSKAESVGSRRSTARASSIASTRMTVKKDLEDLIETAKRTARRF